MKRRPLLRGSILVLALFVAAAMAAPAQAALTVNTTTDSNAPGGCEGAPGDCSLRRAIAKAVPGETVVVPSGSYQLSLGSLSVVQPIAIQGAGARTTSVTTGGGSKHVFVVGAVAQVTISGLTISAGHVTGEGAAFLHGGAVYNTTGSALSLDQVTISGTTLELTSGSGSVRGVGITNNGTLEITNSTVSGNVGKSTGTGNGNQGAGLFNAEGAVSIVNSTITGNSQVASAGATSSGAGIENVGDTIELLNVTIAGNTGSAAIRSNGTMNVRNTIVSNGASGNCAGQVTSLGHNLESADQCGFHAGGDLVGKDPLLGALADNGGPTDTLALLAGSPAIDAGDPAGCPATDQRGIARPQGPVCDIGAFELEPASAALPSNVFRFGKLKRNKRKGTATLTVVVPGPGTLALKGKGVAGKRTAGVKLLIKSKGKAKRRLGRTGKVKVRLRVTYTPSGGAPNTKAKTVKLIKLP